MPTYVYQCSRCGEFEHQQPISETPLERCPQCGGDVRRMIAGGTSFIIKGSGTTSSHCEREKPCCGRETRCNNMPCGK